MISIHFVYIHLHPNLCWYISQLLASKKPSYRNWRISELIQIDLPIQMVMFHIAMLVITITGSSSRAEEHSRSKTHAGLAKPGSFGLTMEVPLARWMV